MKKKRKRMIINIIFWILIILCWGGSFYLERHKVARKINDFYEEPIENLNLTTEQKLADFEYFFECIVSSVPADTLKKYAEQYGIAFYDRYDVYKEMIKNTQNDLEFYCVMSSIGEEIPSFHTGIAYPDYEYYRTLGCWNLSELLDTRYIKSKAAFWNKTLQENAKTVVENNLLSYLFWYKNGNYITDDGLMLLEVNGIPIDEMYDNMTSVKIVYDNIYSKAHRVWMAFYSEPFSQNFSEEVRIKYKNLEGNIEERIVYIDKVAQLLTNYAQSLGVEDKGELYVRDNPFYSYLDEEKHILYLYFSGVGFAEMSSVANIIASADCENIIIDIRRNSGGDFRAVNQYLYPYLYEKDINDDYTWYMPSTKYTKKMTSEWKAIRELAFEKSDFTAIGVNGEQQIYKESTKEVRLIGGKNAKEYNVYLLTSNFTGSAADTLANVLKANDAATLVGTNTGGEGLMNSFLVDYLPESGIVFTYMPALSFNEEGQNNGVYGTAPHYYVDETYPNKAEYEAKGEDPYIYENRLEWDDVLNKAIDLICN